MQYGQYQNQAYDYQQQMHANQNRCAQMPVMSEATQQQQQPMNYESNSYGSYQNSASIINSAKPPSNTIRPATEPVTVSKNGKTMLHAILSKREKTVSPDIFYKEYSSDYLDSKNGCEFPMTGENLIATSSPSSQAANTPATTPLTNNIAASPMSNYVDGIHTPPLSPKEAAVEHVNHTSKACDASSPSADTNAWIKNGSDCKYLFFQTFFTPS